LNGKFYDENNSKYYTCENGTCNSVSAIGYYLSHIDDTNDVTYDSLIKCTQSSCSPPTHPTIDGYYINGESSTPSLIICSNTSSTPTCTISPDPIKTTGYAYLNSGDENNSIILYKGVIICTNNSCISKSTPTSNTKVNYYIDAGESDNNHIIQCDISLCRSIEATTTEGYAYIDGTTEGYVILKSNNILTSIHGGATNDLNKYYINASNTFQIITCTVNSRTNKNTCSSGISGATETKNTYYIDSGINGNIIECTNTGCQSNPAQVGYYINENNNANYPLIECIKNDSSEINCIKIAKSDIINGYYLDGSSTNDGISYTSVIYCNNSKSCEKISTQISGYYLDASSATTSSSRKRAQSIIYSKLIICENEEYKSVETIQIGYYLDGSSSSDNSNYSKVIYCSSSSSCSPITTKIKGYYLDASKTSNDSEYTQLILCNGSKYSSYSEIKEGFYLDGSSSTDNTKYIKIINCSSSNSCSLYTQKNKGYYFDGSSFTDETNYSKLIYYDGNNYISISNINIGYYLDATTKSSDNEEYSGVILCTNSTTCISVETTKKGYYIDGSSYKSRTYSKLIECDGSKYISLDIINVGYYLDGSSTDDDTIYNSVIYCDDSKTCTIISSLIKGYYLDASSATSSSSRKRTQTIIYSKLIICEDEVYKSVETIQIGYYLDGSSSSDNSNYSKVIYCSSSSSCSPITTKIKGYYLDASKTSNDSEYTQLILCNGSKYSSYSEIKEGFYLDGSSSTDNTKYIKIINCSSSNSCSLYTQKNKGYYFDGSSFTDETNYSKLIYYDGNNYISISNINIGYYLDATTKSSDNEEYSGVILCTNSTTCISVETTKKGYYIDGSSYKSRTYSKLIECDGSKYISLDIINVGYYLDGSSTDDDTIYNSVIYCDDSKTCTIISSLIKGYYLDASSVTSSSSRKRTQTIVYTKLIICDENNYQSVTSSLQKGYYLDGGSSNDNINYNKIIYCSDASSCRSVSSTIIGFYFDATSTTDNNVYTKLISCDGNKYTSFNTNQIGYYLDGSSSNNGINYNRIIYCSNAENCEILEKSNLRKGYYMEGSTALTDGTNTKYIQLISCYMDNTSSCKMHDNIENYQTYNPFDGYYINGMNDFSTYPLIRCFDSSCEKIENTIINEGYYLDGSTSIENKVGYIKLISCTIGTSTGCTITSPNDGYYINAESDSSSNAIILCMNQICKIQSPSTSPSYYVGNDQNKKVNGLIICDEPASNSNKCIFKSAFNSLGYYLNDGHNKDTEQLINCTQDKGCQSLTVDLGYYLNIGDIDNNPIIVCNKESLACTSQTTPECQDPENSRAGDYCYDDNKLLFYPINKSDAVYTNFLNGFFTIGSILSGNFPGINVDTTTLFKITPYSITRYFKSGILMIDKNGKLINSLDSTRSLITQYKCDEETMLCSQLPSCTPNIYMYDPENQRAIFCNNGSLEYASFTGYVVDGDRKINNNNPYLIKCENGGKNCVSIKPKLKSSSYYENMGYDSKDHKLIQCFNGNCVTVEATNGFYVGHDGIDIINCTQKGICNTIQPNKNVKYINSGIDNSLKKIIEYNKKYGYTTVKAKAGYYMTYSNNILIECTNTDCNEIIPIESYYDNADNSQKNTIINCIGKDISVTCVIEKTNEGFYTTPNTNTLYHCENEKCQYINVKNGIFHMAVKNNYSDNLSKRSLDLVNHNITNFNSISYIDNEYHRNILVPRASEETYGIIRCISSVCNVLTPEEILAIPICEYNKKKCYIKEKYAMIKGSTTSLSVGEICTNDDRSTFYFATNTIVVKSNVIGTSTDYAHTTTLNNCLPVSNKYNSFFFTTDSSIFRLDKNRIIQLLDSGYYFINIVKNTLISSNTKDDYNNINVKLYSCNEISCKINDKPKTISYYADVNKRIMQYNPGTGVYTFAYNNDIICIYEDNKCTPKASLNNQEFCITYKGEIVLTKENIKSREIGECYKANTIDSSIYVFSNEHLYTMNLYSAQMINQSGYYIIDLTTNTPVTEGNDNNDDHNIPNSKKQNIEIYECNKSLCKIHQPDESIYYYNMPTKTILRYNNNKWHAPSNYGYAIISIYPGNKRLYHLTDTNSEIILNAVETEGHYYTIDNEMYYCSNSENCSEIDDTGYYFTSDGKIYYCVYDSEHLEETMCTKKICTVGQYYYMGKGYYYCKSNSVLVPVSSKYCFYNDNVIINFPIFLSQDYPDNIVKIIKNIEINNHASAINPVKSKNYIKSVSGIFTNCTYNSEETKSNFDLICINNYVKFNEETNDIMICSTEHLSFIECEEDNNNPEKCNVNKAINLLNQTSFLFTIIITIIMTIIFSWLSWH